MKFKDRIVVVTGGAGAVGQAVCRAFLEQGAVVHANYLNDAERERLDSDFRDGVHLRQADLSQEYQVKAWFDVIGAVDVLVNVAGGFDMGEACHTELDAWRKMLTINLDTAFLCSREAIGHMDATKGGRIINVTAFAATGRTGGMTAYVVSKAGVVKLTEAMAEETLNTKITVNAIAPTIMNTPANRQAMPDADTGQWVPLDSVASAILYLACDEAWPITGAVLPLRGHL